MTTPLGRLVCRRAHLEPGGGIGGGRGPRDGGTISRKSRKSVVMFPFPFGLWEMVPFNSPPLSDSLFLPEGGR